MRLRLKIVLVLGILVVFSGKCGTEKKSLQFHFRRADTMFHRMELAADVRAQVLQGFEQYKDSAYVSVRCELCESPMKN